MPAANPNDRLAFRAHWLSAEFLAIDPQWQPHADLRLRWLAGEDSVELALNFVTEGLPDDLRRKHPQLADFQAFRLADESPVSLAELVRGGLAVVGPHAISPVHLAPLLDEIFPDAKDAKLGLTWVNGVPSWRLWAPTAQSVALQIWLGEQPEQVQMVREPDGCWAITGSPAWVNARYRYLVTVFRPGVDRAVTTEVTDPYSVALTPNSTHSLVVDLDDPALAPKNWRASSGPPLAQPVDQVLYELHVRDFSMADKTLPESLRGTYLAFAADGLGARHLRRLARAGLTSVQLLPIADFATVEEDRRRQSAPPKAELRAAAPDSSRQQELIASENGGKAFNWGYDPWHYQTPEGSFATVDATGPQRILECRTMIQALHQMGLRVVLDQVFNHTSGVGLERESVLDRVVPGYYYRLDDEGRLAYSTCCPNVATERMMAEKLMVDSVLVWAKHYRVDGFRFDLMGHHSVANLLAVRAALDALTHTKDGVDGRQITLHGEGWNFGEVADDSRFVQARQGNLGGTGIATFSDRLRDAVRGGGPFDKDPRAQGFGSGLMLASNQAEINGSGVEQRDRLAYYQDLIQLGLAGNLRDYRFGSQHLGRMVTGAELNYHGQPAGYATEPDEVISYVDAHDNETLFDALTLKLHPATTMSERVRMNTLCLAFATLGQSPVLWHGGTDFLRSKSCDRNSYDSGDWFNYLDFSLKDNGFRAGLPPAVDNFESWPYLRPFLADPKLKPRPQDLRRAHQAAVELLMIRRSSPLFRLGRAKLIQEKVSFPASNTWVNVPGVIVMLLDDTVGDAIDEQYSAVLVVFNATPRAVHQRVPMLRGRAFQLAPVQQESLDALIQRSAFFGPEGVLTVPARCVAVFVEPR